MEPWPFLKPITLKTYQTFALEIQMILGDEPYHQYLQAREMTIKISWPSPHWKILFT